MSVERPPRGGLSGIEEGSARRGEVRGLAGGRLHRISYREWGDPTGRRVVVCVHALTRTGRDFGPLAAALVRTPGTRVVAPDMPGRGASERLHDPMLYQIPTYVADAVTLLARIDVEEVDWVGISMGALIGMAIGAMPDSPVRRLVISDAGPVIERAALDRIAGYVGVETLFDSREAAAAAIRSVSAPFGPHTDAEWEFLVDSVLVRRDDGRWTLHYDPAIGVPIRASLSGSAPDLWPLWDAIRAPTLVLRGERSDLLSAATAQAMSVRGPRARVVTLPGVGHAPTLVPAAQVALVSDFLA
ncbi:MAG: alpha/beta hydrolase [Burkholderiales bacterium]